MILNVLTIRSAARATARRQGFTTKWTSCANSLLTTRRSTSTAAKPFYVTTPIFYVNADPHLGHMYSMVLADIIKRWQELRGHKALLSTGIDEHGLKVQKAAEKAETPTQEFCDRGADTFKRLAQAAKVSNDYFARTTDDKHKEAVQYAWMLLQERGYIYHSQHEGWYSISDETFYPESGVELALDNVTGKKRYVSSETGKVVEWTSEVNYKFRLSQFRDQLLVFYKENPQWIEPMVNMNAVQQSVEEGLTDLSVSRPSERVQWGISVPHDNSQNIYVWLDALMNYIVQTGWPSEDFTPGGWPVDVHVIGKDILRFHCIYWPAFLMALELPLPKKIISHAHWTIGKQKMSKSIGNVVNPFAIIDNYGVDSIRWFLALDGRLDADSDYNNLLLAQKYDTMRNKLGNFLNRMMRSEVWNVRRALQATIPTRRVLNSPANNEDRIVFEAVRDFRDHITPMVEKHDIRASLQAIMDLIAQMNAWFHHREPWRDISQNGNKITMSEQLEFTLTLCAESLRISGILLQPYMPNKAKMLLDHLGVRDDQRMWDDAVLGGDSTYGTSKAEMTSKNYLFPKISLR